jgi:predicted alpha/beta superfamily hydrolase
MNQPNQTYQNEFGTLYRFGEFPSKWVNSRTIDVWKPTGIQPDKRYPVLYMQDGQNIITPETSTTGISWGVAETLYRLVQIGEIQPHWVVGVWHDGVRRWNEYMPQQALNAEQTMAFQHKFAERLAGELRGVAYLRFLVQELKTWVDATFATLPQAETTTIMGSSMGGLSALNALSTYPQVFGAAGCLSSHWTAGEQWLVSYFEQVLPMAGKHRIYFDYGTQGLDAHYEVWQLRMDDVMRLKGYQRGTDWLTEKFVGANHHERDWRERLPLPLSFLLKPYETD